MTSKSEKFPVVEEWVSAQLKKRGYDAIVKQNYTTRALDVSIEGMPIAVKVAKRGTRRIELKTKVAQYPKYQWNCTSVMGTVGEFPVVLVAHTPVGTNHAFIVPASVIRERGNEYPSITRHPDEYNGWLKPYLGLWDLVSEIKRDWYIEQGQLDLFAEYTEVLQVDELSEPAHTQDVQALKDFIGGRS